MSQVNASFAKVPARAARSKLSATDWAVLHVIGLHADKDGRAFPSMARIADIAGINRSNVPRALTRLEKRGLLVRHRTPKPGGGWQVNHYQLVFEAIGDVVPGDNILGGVSSAGMTDGVINGDDTRAAVSSVLMTGCHQHRRQGVIQDDALTDHLTDQRTDLTRKEEVERVEDTAAAGVIPADNTRAAGPPCRWYVPNSIGFRLCGLPAVDGERCAEHASIRSTAPS